MRTEFPGRFALLRFTDGEEFAEARRGDWWPDSTHDYAAFRTWVREQVDITGQVILAARDDDPGSDQEHRVVLLRALDVPWRELDPRTRRRADCRGGERGGAGEVKEVGDAADLDDSGAVDVIVIEDSDGLTVLSYPSTPVALTAFFHHLIDRHVVGRGYHNVNIADLARVLAVDGSAPTPPPVASTDAGAANGPYGSGPALLRWDTGSDAGNIGTCDGRVTITLDEDPLVGIDLTTGQVIVWPDGEIAHTAEQFAPRRQPEQPAPPVIRRCTDPVWFRTHLPAQIGSHQVIETIGWMPGVPGRTRASCWAITRHPDHGYATHLVKGPDDTYGWILDLGDYDVTDLHRARAVLLERAGFASSPGEQLPSRMRPFRWKPMPPRRRPCSPTPSATTSRWPTWTVNGSARTSTVTSLMRSGLGSPTTSTTTTSTSAPTSTSTPTSRTTSTAAPGSRHDPGARGARPGLPVRATSFL